MKKIGLVILSICLLSFIACRYDSNDDSPSSSNDKTTTTSTASDYTANSSTRDIIAVDDVLTETFGNTIYLNLSDLSFSSDGSTYTTITATTKKSADTVITGVGAYISDNVIILNTESYSANLEIVVAGTLASGSLAIKTGAYAVALKLSDVTITSGNYPPIEIKGNNTKSYIILDGTNTLTDGRSYGIGYSEAEGTDYYTSSYTGTAEDGAELTTSWAQGSDTKGSLYSKGAIIFSGDGSLSITEGYKHGVYSKDFIRIENGTISVTTTGRNGFQAVNGFVMEDGTISVVGNGTNTNNESRGIIVEGSENYPGEGFIEIHGGTININTYSKGISAKWDIDDDAETTDTTDDPYPYVKVSGGSITVKTRGTPKDESSSSVTFTDADGISVSEKTKLSPEGIEGKQAVFITGGEITATTTDDCINASREGSASVEISGGKIYAYSSSNDAVDSNGTLTISGGTIVALTSTTPECAFDCDNYTFTITGGTLVGIGTNNYSRPTSSTCKQSTFVLSGNYFGAGGKTMAVTNSSGDAVFAFTIPSSIFGTNSSSSYIMILSSPDIATGTSYNIKTGVTVTGGSEYNGLYTTLPAVTSGSTTVTGASTSTSDYVYVKSSSSNGGAQEGTHP